MDAARKPSLHLERDHDATRRHLSHWEPVHRQPHLTHRSCPCRVKFRYTAWAAPFADQPCFQLFYPTWGCRLLLGTDQSSVFSYYSCSDSKGADCYQMGACGRKYQIFRLQQTKAFTYTRLLAGSFKPLIPKPQRFNCTGHRSEGDYHKLTQLAPSYTLQHKYPTSCRDAH